MNVLIFGGTGLVGRPIVKQALAAGHRVTLFTRRSAHVTLSDPHLIIFEGSVTNPTDVAKALHGQDAVIQCIGIGGKGDGKKTTVASEASHIITQEMTRAGVTRYIAMSVIGAGDSWRALPWIYRKCILPLFQRWFVPIIEDKERMERDIQLTALDWTIVRGTTVKDAPAKGIYRASLDGRGISFSIAAEDLARFIISQLSDTTYLRQAPIVCG